MSLLCDCLCEEAEPTLFAGQVHARFALKLKRKGRVCVKDLRPLMALVWFLLLSVACGGTGPESDAPSPTAETPAAGEGVQATELSFTSIAQDAPLGDEPAEAAYVAIDDAEGWERAAERLPADAVEAGRSAMDNRVVFVAFAGAKGSSGYQIAIQSMVVQDDELLVTVAEESPGEEEVVEPAMTVPFHVVAVAAEAIPDGTTTVRFQDEGGRTLAEVPNPLP